MKRNVMFRLSHPFVKGGEQSILELFNCLSRQLGGSYSASRPEDVIDIRIDASAYDSVLDFRRDYLLAEVASKFPFSRNVDLKAVALKAFFDAEAQCSLTNETVRVDTRGPHGLSWHAVLETARRKISHLLGPFSWDLAEVHCGFGPGATTSLRRGKSDAFYKFGSKPDVTPDCALLAWHAVRRIPLWFEALTGQKPGATWVEDYFRFKPEEIFNLVAGNRVTTVPKNAKTERVIAIEPDLNMFLQKGIGGLIRSRLRRARINLNSQSLNQRLARIGSRYGTLATVDFKAASDTISLAIVEELLPPSWVCALKQTRSPIGVLPDGSIHPYSKFSSMGNGFTFELESLIFWALSRAVADLSGIRGIVMVYGDDLIVKAETREAVEWAFSRAGFTLNEKKSFFTGPFRESCGKHFFRGTEVSPFYIRKPIKTVWDLYSLANKIRKWARYSYGCDSSLKPVYDYVVEAIPRPLRYRIPDGIGDVGLIADFDESTPRFNRRLFSLYCVGYLPVTSYTEVDGSSALLKYFSMAGREPTEVSARRLPRVHPTRGKPMKFAVRRWSHYGPWL